MNMNKAENVLKQLLGVEPKTVVVGKIGGETLKELRAADFEEQEIQLEVKLNAAQFHLDLLRKRGPNWVATKESEKEDAALVEERVKVFTDLAMANLKRQQNIWRIINAELGLKEDDDGDYQVDRETGIVERVVG
jgi:hypothetical protein